MKYDFETMADRSNMDARAIDDILALKEKYQIEKPMIPMWIADMNFPTSPSIQREIMGRLEHPFYGYFEPRKEFYESIIWWNEVQKRIKIEPEMIGYENGVMGAITTVIRAFTKPGDAIFLNLPAYNGHISVLEQTGRKMVTSDLYVDASNTWRMDYEEMEKVIQENHVKVVILCSPHNPTGRVWEKEELQRAYEIYRKCDCIVVCDEIWSDLILEGYHYISPYLLSEDARNRTIFLHSPTKSFNLSGMVGAYHYIPNEEMRKRYCLYSQYSNYNQMNLLFMYAMIGAYSKEGFTWLKELNQVITENVNIATEYIRKEMKGCSVANQQGTYLLFLDIRKWCQENGIDHGSAYKKGIKQGIIWSNGEIYGKSGHIRLNVAVPKLVVMSAFERMKESIFV